MTLPATGSISFNQVNVELSRSGTAALSLNDSAVRSVAGVGGSGTQISMSDLRGKSAVSLTSPMLFNGNSYTANTYGTGCSLTLNMNADGTWTTFTYGDITSTSAYYSGTWKTGSGGTYYVRFTRNSSSGSGSATASTGWLQLNATRAVTVVVSAPSGTSRTHTANYTVDISADQSTVLVSNTITLIATDNSGFIP